MAGSSMGGKAAGRSKANLGLGQHVILTGDQFLEPLGASAQRQRRFGGTLRYNAVQ